MIGRGYCRQNDVGTPARLRCARGGWSIMHMLAMISLLGVFLLSASQLFMTTQRTFSRSQSGMTAGNQAEHMQRTLRMDVWSAIGWKQLNDQAIQLELPNGETVAWRFEGSTLSREVTMDEPTDVPAKEWRLSVDRGTLSIDSASLTVQMSSSKRGHVAEFRFVNQKLLANALVQQGGEQ